MLSILAYNGKFFKKKQTSVLTCFLSLLWGERCGYYLTSSKYTHRLVIFFKKTISAWENHTRSIRKHKWKMIILNMLGTNKRELQQKEANIGPRYVSESKWMKPDSVTFILIFFSPETFHSQDLECTNLIFLKCEEKYNFFPCWKC